MAQSQADVQRQSQINAGIGIGQTCNLDPTPTLVSLVSTDAAFDRGFR